jgi:hypothetical protein
MLTSSRACSPTLEVSASVDMTTWRPASLPRRVPLAGGTRSSAVSRPIVLATGASPTGQGEVGVQGPPGQPLELLAVHPDAGRDRPQPAAARPGGRAPAPAQVDTDALEHRPAPDRGLTGQQHAERRPLDAGQEPGGGVAGPAEHPGVGVGHGQEQVGRALSAEHRPHLGRVPGRHGLEQGRVVGQGGHGIVGPLDPGQEGRRGRAAGRLQLGADLPLAGAGHRLPAVGGDRGHRQHHDDDEEQCEAGP